MKRKLFFGALALGVTATAAIAYLATRKRDEVIDPQSVDYPECPSISSLDQRINELANAYISDASAFLSELTRIEEPGDRYNFIKQRILELGAAPSIEDEPDGIKWIINDDTDISPKKVFYVDGLMPNRASPLELQGIVTQIFSSKILLESISFGAIAGITIVFIIRTGIEREFMQGPLQLVPDAVILTRPSNNSINIGHRGRYLASTSFSGPDSLTLGSQEITKISFAPKTHPFMGDSTYSVPFSDFDGNEFSFVVDYRNTIGDTQKPTGEVLQSFEPWWTPPDHAAIVAAVETLKRATRSEQASVSKWYGFTAGPSYCIDLHELKFSIEGKKWVTNGNLVHPPMFGIGAGNELQCGTDDESFDLNQLLIPIFTIARFPSVYIRQ